MANFEITTLERQERFELVGKPDVRLRRRHQDFRLDVEIKCRQGPELFADGFEPDHLDA